MAPRGMAFRPGRKEVLAYWTRRLAAPFERAPADSARVFCVSVQRCGTTSLGQFCRDQLGMVHRGYRHALINGWTRDWAKAHFPDARSTDVARAEDRLFRSADFVSGEVFEDDPWWCPGMPETLLRRFPDAKFVMFTRPAEDWFRSMLAHSGGRTLGFTDVHAWIYDRWEEYLELRASTRNPEEILFNGLSMSGLDAHYQRVFTSMTERTLDCFAGNPSFFHARLDDPEKFSRLARFLGHSGTYETVWANKSRDRPPA